MNKAFSIFVASLMFSATSNAEPIGYPDASIQIVNLDNQMLVAQIYSEQAGSAICMSFPTDPSFSAFSYMLNSAMVDNRTVHVTCDNYALLVVNDNSF